MSTPRKLSEKAQMLLKASESERLAHIDKPLFIPYPQATSLLAEMEDLLSHPKTNRMPNILIAARSNNGKTEILREFLARHPAEDRIDMDSVYAPAVYIQSPPGPNEHVFLDQMLMMFGMPIKRNEASDTKLTQVMSILRRAQTKVLLVDELNALLAGSVTKQRFFLNMLKYISNELKISIVASGTKDAIQAVKSDDQIENRFPVRVLPRWREGEDFRRLLYSFEYILPLREASEIYRGELAARLYGVSDGVIGELATVIRSAAKYAVHKGEEKITMEGIDNCSYLNRKATQGEGLL